MAREYCLMCPTCKEFIDIHKFPLPPDLISKSPTGIEGIPIDLFDIEESIGSLSLENEDHKWIFDLMPIATTFVKEHLNHDLRIVDDSEPDYYWWPEHIGYTEWKEISTNLRNELFLPRNLIEDLKIKEWKKAEEYLKSLNVVLYDELELTEYKNKFNQLTQTNNDKN